MRRARLRTSSPPRPRAPATAHSNSHPASPGRRYERRLRQNWLDNAIIGRTSEGGGGSKPTTWPSDVEADNGVIHTIASVLLPGGYSASDGEAGAATAEEDAEESAKQAWLAQQGQSPGGKEAEVPPTGRD